MKELAIEELLLIFQYLDIGNKLKFCQISKQCNRISVDKESHWLNSDFLKLVKLGKVTLVSNLLDHKNEFIDPSFDNNICIQLACFFGNTVMVELLLKVDSVAKKHETFGILAYAACLQNHFDCFKSIVLCENFSEHDCLRVLEKCAYYGRLSMIQFLLSMEKVTEIHNYQEVLYVCHYNNQLDALKLILGSEKLKLEKDNGKIIEICLKHNMNDLHNLLIQNYYVPRGIKIPQHPL